MVLGGGGDARDGSAAVFDIQLHFGGTTGIQGRPAACYPHDCNSALEELSPTFAWKYGVGGRPQIAPEKLLRARLLQILYTVRSERLLIEQLDYNLLFRWFVGLSMDDPVWDVTVFTKNRERLLAGEVAHAFFNAVLD